METAGFIELSKLYDTWTIAQINREMDGIEHRSRQILLMTEPFRKEGGTISFEVMDGFDHKGAISFDYEWLSKGLQHATNMTIRDSAGDEFPRRFFTPEFFYRINNSESRFSAVVTREAESRFAKGPLISTIIQIDSLFHEYGHKVYVDSIMIQDPEISDRYFESLRKKSIMERAINIRDAINSGRTLGTEESLKVITKDGFYKNIQFEQYDIDFLLSSESESSLFAMKTLEEIFKFLGITSDLYLQQITEYSTLAYATYLKFIERIKGKTAEDIIYGR